jgi:uncharacterized membrane protein
MKLLARAIGYRPRMTAAFVAGGAAAWLAAGELHPVSRALVGWNVGVWLYLVLVGWMMFRADRSRLQKNAQLHAEGAAAVLLVVVGAVVASMVAIVVELAHTGGGTVQDAGRLLFAAATVVGSWLLLPLEFTLQYASLYHRDGPEGGLRFPDSDPAFQPDYSDFLYFAFTIAVASQTSDVVVTERPLRRLVLLHSVLSFAFNTAILALSVNVAASLVRM